jgi:hypothetical protein
MWEVMNACVIMHNMITESESADPEAAAMTFESQGLLVKVDHKVSAQFGASIAMHE